jgi:hypothetical protein
VQFVLTINAAILIELLTLAIPDYFVLRDMQRAAKRFGLDVSPSELTSQKEEQYLAAARRVFEEDPKVAVFVYGHTHAPSIRHVDGRAVVNTGTWIKEFERVNARWGLLPQVYVPKYCINYPSSALKSSRHRQVAGLGAGAERNLLTNRDSVVDCPRAFCATAAINTDSQEADCSSCDKRSSLASGRRLLSNKKVYLSEPRMLRRVMPTPASATPTNSAKIRSFAIVLPTS